MDLSFAQNASPNGCSTFLDRFVMIKRQRIYFDFCEKVFANISIGGFVVALEFNITLEFDMLGVKKSSINIAFPQNTSQRAVQAF